MIAFASWLHLSNDCFCLILANDCILSLFLHFLLLLKLLCLSVIFSNSLYIFTARSIILSIIKSNTSSDPSFPITINYMFLTLRYRFNLDRAALLLIISIACWCLWPLMDPIQKSIPPGVYTRVLHSAPVAVAFNFDEFTRRVVENPPGWFQPFGRHCRCVSSISSLHASDTKVLRGFYRIKLLSLYWCTILFRFLVTDMTSQFLVFSSIIHPPDRAVTEFVEILF